MPPLDTVVLSAVPPATTFWVALLPIVVLVALPNTTWALPDSTRVLVAEPASFWIPPLDTMVPVAMPPATTFWVPPLRMLAEVSLAEHDLGATGERGAAHRTGVVLDAAARHRGAAGGADQD